MSQPLTIRRDCVSRSLAHALEGVRYDQTVVRSALVVFIARSVSGTERGAVRLLCHFFHGPTRMSAAGSRRDCRNGGRRPHLTMPGPKGPAYGARSHPVEILGTVGLVLSDPPGTAMDAGNGSLVVLHGGTPAPSAPPRPPCCISSAPCITNRSTERIWGRTASLIRGG